jgi:hypothetical protein
LKIRFLLNEAFFYLVPEELDPLEMLEAANITDRLPKDFFDKMVSFQSI